MFWFLTFFPFFKIFEWFSDVNLVAEPKVSSLNSNDEIHSPATLCSQPHQIGRKRQNISKTDNDWDYFYDRWASELRENARKFVRVQEN